MTMIRINLLPPSARRRRRRQPGRERSTLFLMSFGWAALITAGALWISATAADVADLRAQADAISRQTARAIADLGEAALSERQALLRDQHAALERLRGDRRSPAATLAELAALVAAEDPAAAATASPFAGRERAATLWLTALRGHGDGRWTLAGSARDVAALTGLQARLQASPRLAAVGRPEYARDPTGRLEFQLELRARD